MVTGGSDNEEVIDLNLTTYLLFCVVEIFLPKRIYTLLEASLYKAIIHAQTAK